MARKTATPRKRTAGRTSTAVTVVSESKKTEAGGIKDKLNAAVEEVRESSRENMLAGLGLISRLRQQRAERMAELVEEGKRFEPEVKQAFEDLKAKLQVNVDLKEKFKFDRKSFDRDAIKARVEEGMTGALHRMGLATRKEVDVLAKKVNKLADLQHA
ncbi:MAG TPA: phasin family protein [Rubrivivax sp.]|nr:phasin family protein [Rubrivivax sp.]HPP82302.1 phasin family protein [Rubrivivax sp.]